MKKATATTTSLKRHASAAPVGAKLEPRNSTALGVPPAREPYAGATLEMTGGLSGS